MALLTFGEGYHNFHHYFQADYRNGIRWFQFDPTKWLIQILKQLKLAKKLKRTPDFKIIGAKLQMKMKEARASYRFNEQSLNELEALREKIIDTLKIMDDLRKQYDSAKNKISTLNLNDLKRRMKISKVEFQYNLKAFELMLSQQRLA